MNLEKAKLTLTDHSILEGQQLPNGHIAKKLFIAPSDEHSISEIIQNVATGLAYGRLLDKKDDFTIFVLMDNDFYTSLDLALQRSIEG